ncbi:Uncharacterised protein [Mycobacterium tuberculosis]|nr:Uncharacterised protein [Mycobacterium tuberculosis]
MQPGRHDQVEPAQHRLQLGGRAEQPPVARIEPGVQRQPRAFAGGEPVRQLPFDAVVQPPPPVLPLARCEHDPGHRHGRGLRQRRQVVPRGRRGRVAREHGVEPGGRRIVRVDDRNADGDADAARVPAVQLLDLRSVQRPAGEHQMGVGGGVGAVEVQAARPEDRAPGQPALDPRLVQPAPHRLHRQHVARRRLTVQEARPSGHQDAHPPASPHHLGHGRIPLRRRGVQLPATRGGPTHVPHRARRYGSAAMPGAAGCPAPRVTLQTPRGLRTRPYGQSHLAAHSPARSQVP